MKRTVTIVLLLLLTLLAEGQTINHTLLVGPNSSAYRARAPVVGHWGWGWSAGYRLEFSFSKIMSAGVSADYARSSTLLYSDCNCIHPAIISISQRHTILVDDLSIPVFIKWRTNKHVDRYSYFLVGIGVDGILQSHRTTERQVINALDGSVTRTLMQEGPYELRNSNSNAIGSNYQLTVGRRFALKGGLGLMLELGVRKDLNKWIYFATDERGMERGYPISRQWGYLLLGVAF